MQLLHSKIIGAGKPLIILHGLLGMGDNWITAGKEFSKNGYQVHLVDQRNHGKSFHSDEMDYENMVGDLHTYITHHQLKNINLLGHSMGGKTAMHFAMDYPELIHKMIVVDIAPVYYPPHHHFIFKAIQSIDLSHFQKRKEIEEALSIEVENNAIRNFILKNLARKDNNYTWKPNVNVLENSLEELGDAISVNSVFKKPTLFIRGEKSPYIQEKHFLQIKSHFPNSQIITIEDAGHWVHAEKFDRFMKICLTFLND